MGAQMIERFRMKKEDWVDQKKHGTPFDVCVNDSQTNKYWALIRGGSIRDVIDAFQSGDLNCYQIIVKPSGHTVLHQSILLNRRDLFRLCETFGTDYDARDSNGVTPLMKAAALRRTDLMKALLKNGAKKDLRDNKGRDALFYANYYEAFEAAKILANDQYEQIEIDQLQQIQIQ